MLPVVPNESVLKPGDWLVLAGPPVVRPAFVLTEDRSEVLLELSVSDWWPWKTVMGYYGGRKPLDHHFGPRVAVELRRVTAEWRVASGER